MNLIKSSLKHPQVTLSVLCLICLVGIYSLLYMPRREDPKITIRQGLVIAYYPGANSAQVEEQVTKKLEQYLFQFAEVRKEKTFSTSRDGVVVINVELEEWVKNPDVFWSKLKHEMNLAKAIDLPEGVMGPIVNSDFGDTIALLIGVESDSLSYSELKENVQKIDDVLRTIKAVSKIKRYGEQKEQITITSSSEKLSQYGVKLPQVVQVLQSQNSINATGEVNTDISKVPLYSKGYYSTEKEIENQIVGTAPTGQVLRIGDVAHVERKYAEPKSKATINGKKALLLSVEMQEGNNIVQFGDDVAKKLEEISHRLPGSIKISTIVNQPKIVQRSVGDFIREFFIAIIAVIIVTLLLLPFRIASVAAMAIPVTVAVTFAMLNILGIELHQVSLASLIVCLGMVVDDAIVIADNYVELLDQGYDRRTAAWKSARDLVIPVLTATVTIIASFLPMVILNGSVGEFIFSLPITVTVALSSSFVVAMLLTPYLCYTFVKQGLHNHEEAKNSDVAKEKKKKFSILDLMQSSYDSGIEWCMRNPKITISAGVISLLLAGVLFHGIRQKFFPAAERNQFVVEIWMPTDTKLEKTEDAVKKVESLIKNDSRVQDYASFIGTSAPRFYYNFSPEPPIMNYAQVLINTHTDKQTEELADELIDKVGKLIPEGRPQVKLMQQGQNMKAPVEVRVIGDNLDELKKIGAKVEAIVHKAEGAMLVYSDFHEDYYGISINLKPEANRLGFTTSSIAKNVYTGFAGAPISRMWEGNNSVDIVLRLDENNRRNFDDLANLYIMSPVTGASVPLRQIADLKPEWQSGRIMHRNGMRTLTIECEPKPKAMASEVLRDIRPEIDKLQLPPSFRIEYGGEYENQKTTFSQMIVALGISIILIYLILLFQFRTVKLALLVMTSIPLSVFGAFLGLTITHNPFGFTAFMGLISLSGIVVRNSIILVDYANELVSKGTSIPVAALEAGKRRLRPIFLTAMAAAIGVVPMILSGSQLWSPLASVLAVGVVFSMVMTLVVVPVLYVWVVKPEQAAELQA
ncbi:MAG: efflux RND transporter permease subunit [Ignavibacteria bacterium]|nr:efflux RND transporter permease subunit [Ignavibacteria bacterium]